MKQPQLNVLTLPDMECISYYFIVLFDPDQIKTYGIVILEADGNLRLTFMHIKQLTVGNY